MESQGIYEDVLVALRRIIRAVDLYSKKLVQYCGLTGPQLTVLQQVIRLGEASVGEIATRVKLSAATVTEILGRLEKQSLITRVRSATDRRRVLVRPTDQGRKVAENTPPLLQDSFVAEYSMLQDWEQTAILSALQRVAAMMEVKESNAAPLLTRGSVSATAEETLDFLAKDHG